MEASPKPASNDEIFLSLRRLIRPSSGESICIFLVLFNLTVIFGRPQDLPGLGWIGAARLPMLISALPLLAWLTRLSKTWTLQTRMMMLFLVVEGFRTILGKVVFDELVRNDFNAYHTWKDLFLQFCTLVFPAAVFIASGAGLRRFNRTWILLGVFLAVYAITHTGMGPGGFIGDENDVGLALLVYLPFPLAFITEYRRQTGRKVFFLAATAVILLGVVSTVSRGAFVGLVCVLTYFFLRSKRKFVLLMAAGFLALIVVPFLPKDYVSEMQSIQDTSGGTAEIRKHYWTLATRVFLDPRHTLFGVGLQNTTFHLADYETGEDLVQGPSAAGRAVHSLYFEILADTGLWGILVVGTIVLSSYRANSKNLQNIDRMLRVLNSASSENPTGNTDRQLALAASEQIRGELEFLLPFIMATNVAFIALFTAGAFISVFYYPMLWLMAGLSVVSDRYLKSVLALAERLRILPSTPVRQTFTPAYS